MYSSRLERPVTLAVVLVESALGPSGRLEYLCVLNILRRAMIESARLLFESARVQKFRKLELQLDYHAGLDSTRSIDFITFFSHFIEATLNTFTLIQW